MAFILLLSLLVALPSFGIDMGAPFLLPSIIGPASPSDYPRKMP
jgi:hypothetical protein